ncbi:MAG: hypothetical protein CMJ94_15390 [Planctomycetes bacterium]|nr:hypothetical protein [Planctomycetota bacterium]
MNPRAATALILVWIVGIVAWLLLTRSPQDFDASSTASPQPSPSSAMAQAPTPTSTRDASPREPQAEAASAPPAAGTDAPRTGIRFLRADGSPAAQLPVVFGDARLRPAGADARKHVWVTTDDEGYARITESDRMQMVLFQESDRGFFVGAQFPYLGEAQVLFPLQLDDLDAVGRVLHLRPAGAVLVRLGDQEAQTSAPRVSLQLDRPPIGVDPDQIHPGTTPFGGLGHFEAQQRDHPEGALFPWVGVGVGGVAGPRPGGFPAVRSFGPLHEGDVEELELRLSDPPPAPTLWLAQLVDPEGRPFAPASSLIWSLDILRDGRVWARTGGPAQPDEQGHVRLELGPALPPILDEDRAVLRFNTLRERWAPIELTEWLQPGEHDLGMLGLGPLPQLAAGTIRLPGGQPAAHLRLDVYFEDAEVPGKPLESPRPQLARRGDLGTDPLGGFQIRGDAQGRPLLLLIHETPWTLPQILPFQAGRGNWEIQLKPRPGLDGAGASNGG